ncbi:carbohydrate ABC transporter permease [Cohnella terricola]|uniref:Carbohydrate ABC transporter permease n=2 Tax=Cohnella terricola TaxID=1289167 RepID=A0A559JTY4_9BACL|nr:carbohydrate ABC transporter permease [Cohnella terricola]
MLRNVLLLALALLFLIPFYISIVYSLKSREEITASGIRFPSVFHWENYSRAMEISNFGHALKNSSIVTLVVTVVLLIVCSMASYIIARNSRNRFYNSVYYVFLAAVLIPFQVIMLPLYINLKDWGLLNTLGGLSLALIAFQIPYNIFVMTGFIKSVPRDLEEAAYIDGAGAYRTFWSVIFPVLKPITSTTFILNALAAWNDFQTSLIVVQKEAVRTLPLTQFYFIGQYSVEVNLAFAAFTLSVIPVLIFYFAAQRYIIGGMMGGAVKG